MCVNVIYEIRVRQKKHTQIQDLDTYSSSSIGMLSKSPTGIDAI